MWKVSFLWNIEHLAYILDTKKAWMYLWCKIIISLQNGHGYVIWKLASSHPAPYSAHAGCTGAHLSPVCLRKRVSSESVPELFSQLSWPLHATCPSHSFLPICWFPPNPALPLASFQPHQECGHGEDCAHLHALLFRLFSFPYSFICIENCYPCPLFPTLFFSLKPGHHLKILYIPFLRYIQWNDLGAMGTSKTLILVSKSHFSRKGTKTPWRNVWPWVWGFWSEIWISSCFTRNQGSIQRWMDQAKKTQD